MGAALTLLIFGVHPPIYFFKMQKNISLKNLTTFKIGGKARYFLEAKNKEEIISAIKWAQEKSLPFFVLGGGSNVLISDKKYKGLIIQVKSQNAKVKIESQNAKVIEIDAGVALGKLVGVALQNSLTGMEWAMGIPGTVGGAMHGNAGAFNQSISDVVEEVEVMDIEKPVWGQTSPELGAQAFRRFAPRRVFSKEECGFSYRDSIFKKNKNLIILSAKIKLQTGDKIEIENKMREYFQKKKQTQPLEFFSAGSIFKNKENYKAAELIEKAGLKGKRIGGAEISNKHSNFIVSNGHSKARDVKKLIDLIKKVVRQKFNIELQEEIIFLNF